jgi:hypothetical protein
MATFKHPRRTWLTNVANGLMTPQAVQGPATGSGLG